LRDTNSKKKKRKRKNGFVFEINTISKNNLNLWDFGFFFWPC